MPHDDRFDLLRGFRLPWLVPVARLGWQDAVMVTTAFAFGRSDETQSANPPFLVQVVEGDVELSLDAAVWEEMLGCSIETKIGDGLTASARGERVVAVEAPGVAATLRRATESGAAVMFWPALGGYELMRSDHTRWAELGVECVAASPPVRT